MPEPIPAPKHTSAVVESFWLHSRRYISRYSDCGKKNCQKCGGAGDRRASHGPYWYLCFTENGRWKQVYLGKELDTKRFITAQGNIDLPAIKARRRPRSPLPHVAAPNPLPPLPLDQIPAYDVAFAGRLPRVSGAVAVPDPDPGPVPERDP